MAQRMIFSGRINEKSDNDRMSEMDCSDDDIFDNPITHAEFNKLFNSSDTDEPCHAFDM